MPDLSGRSTIIWIAGVDWDAVPGTDKRLVSEIARIQPVIWVDPPRMGGWGRWLRGERSPTNDSEAITRVRVPATIGATRFPVRWLTSVVRHLTVRRTMRSVDVYAMVVANPIALLPRRGPRKVLYVTDDWPAGASLMGLNPAWVKRTLARNARRADAIVAVSPPLVDLVTKKTGRQIPSIVLPNGVSMSAPFDGPDRRPLAVFVGQINERIDLSLLEALVQEGVHVRIVGPNVIRDADTKARFSRLVEDPLADWVGIVPPESVPGHLGEAAVGLTPYTSSAFNMASSPLKTLEYLAAGLPVVSSDLPASRWLDTPHVVTCPNTSSFVTAVKRALECRGDSLAEESRRAFAAEHTWSQRAATMSHVIDSVQSAS